VWARRVSETSRSRGAVAAKPGHPCGDTLSKRAVMPCPAGIALASIMAVRQHRGVRPDQIAVDYWLAPIRPEDMPVLAAQLLTEGHDSPAIRHAAALAACDDPATIRSVFEQALNSGSGSPIGRPPCRPRLRHSPAPCLKASSPRRNARGRSAGSGTSMTSFTRSCHLAWKSWQRVTTSWPSPERSSLLLATAERLMGHGRRGSAAAAPGREAG
jgi:hypothetical protein